ncbi:CarD family transcriptional regulator [Lachnospiraceae bacterium LCP25S3_G4]
MFKKGDYIVHGNNGVCKVVDVGTLDTRKVSNDRIYYTLSPCYTKGNTIFTPADNQKVIMRPVMTKSEAIQLIDEIKDMDALWIEAPKKREIEYKEAVHKCDCRELVKVIKAIYSHKQVRLAEGKKITLGDEKYFRMAEDNLYGELAISMDMDRDAVKEFVIQRVETLEELSE